MVAQTRRMSVAEFLALPDDENLHELVRGELRVMAPPKGGHGVIEAAILVAIGVYLRGRAEAMGWEPSQGVTAQHRLVGFVAGGEFGLRFAVPDDPDQIRGVD